MKVIDFEQEDWNELIEKINDECCILLLGPNLYKDSEQRVLQDLLYKQLRKKFEDELFDMFPEDGFFVPTDNNIINDMRRIVKNFYKKDYPDESLKKIAEIPFHCLISLTPDMLLKQTFDKYDVKNQFERFSMTKPVAKDLKDASKQNPLIYNMFGSIEEDETIILTHDDFFNYLKNIIGDERLPTKIRESINKATDLIFIGFPFEKWWVQLLMRLLGLHVFPGRNRWAIKGTKESNFTKIAKKQFRITFIYDEADQFIKLLYENYSKSTNKLRTLNLTKIEAEQASHEIKKKEIAELKEQILQAMDLRYQFENKRMLSDNPKEEARCEKEIEKLNEQIKIKSRELKTLKK